MATAHYFSMKTVQDAIKALAEKDYLTFDNKKRILRVKDFQGYVGVVEGEGKSREDSAPCTDRFVGTMLPKGAEDPTQRRIGDAGKIRALLCFRPAFRRAADRGEQPGHLSETIVGASSRTAETEGLRVMMTTSLQNRSRASEKIDRQSFRTTVLDPSPQSADARLLGKVIKFVATGLAAWPMTAERAAEPVSADELERRIISVLNDGHPTPADCARALCAVLGFQPPAEDDVAFPLPQSWLEDYVAKYVDAEGKRPLETDGTQLAPTVRSVKLALSIPSEEGIAKRVVVLKGPEESGKKAVVGDLLRSFEPKDDHRMPLLGNNLQTRQELPIMVISLQLRDYRSLAHHVLAFLRRQAREHRPVERAEDAAHARTLAQHAFEKILNGVEAEFSDTVPLAALFQEIERAHTSHPSLFVFLDANDLSRGSQSRVLHQKGLVRLLSVLHRSEPESRFLITTSDLQRVEGLISAPVTEFTVDMPPLKRMGWYLKTPQGQAAFEALRLQPRSKMDRLVPGDILAVCAAMADLGCGTDALASMINACLQLMPARKTDAPVVTRHDPYYEAASLYIYRKYAETLAGRGGLHAVALVAAAAYSRDTLMHSSLEHMHERLRQSLAAPNETIPALPVEELTAVVEAAKSMVVRRVTPASVDLEELGVVELKTLARFQPEQDSPGSGTPGELQITDQLWEVGLTSAIWLLRAMTTPPPSKDGTDKAAPINTYADIAKCALREIARGARRRAQNKRLRKSNPDAPASRLEIARDIQCLETLLASLPDAMGDIVQTPDPKEPRPRLKAKPVFATTDDFRADTAFAFAYHVLLRSDIDAQHQLSMRFDFDTTRLRSYLLLVIGLGELQTWTMEDLRTPDAQIPTLLPQEVPAYVQYALGPVELHRLLLTIAISALHCQLPNVVLWSWEQASKLFIPNEETWQEGVESHGRHIATMLDASIHLGRPLKDEEGTLLTVLKLATELSDAFEETARLGATQDESEANPAPTPEPEPELEPELELEPTEHLTDDPTIANMVPPPPLTRPGMRIALRRAELLAATDETPDRAIELLGVLVEAERQRLPAPLQDRAILTSGRSGRQCARLLLLNFPITVRAPLQNSTLLQSGLPKDKIESGLDMLSLVVETNLSRMNHNAGMDRISIVADLVRVHAMRWLYVTDGQDDLDHAVGYLDLMNEQERNSSISDGARLELTMLRAATNWMVTWTEHFAVNSQSDRAAERLDEVQQDIERAMAISSRIGFKKTCVDLLILKARYDWLKTAIEAKCTGSELEVSNAIDLLDKADAKAQAIEYRAARPIIADWKAWMEGPEA